MDHSHTNSHAALVFLLLIAGNADAQQLEWYRTWPFEYENNMPANYLADPLVAVDGTGNTWMVSQLQGTLDVDPGAGTEFLSADNDLPSTTTPAAVCVGKFAPDGELLWTRHFGYSSGVKPWAAATDVVGNLLVGGQFRATADMDPGPGVDLHTSAGDRDAFITKLDPNGDLLWAHRFGGSGGDDIREMTLDATGNVYVLLSASGALDVDPGPQVQTIVTAGQLTTLLKLAPTGELVWVRQLVSAGAYLAIEELAIDPDGALLLAGTYSQSSVDLDPGTGIASLPMVMAQTTHLFVAKWTADGEHIWSRSVVGINTVWGLAADMDGNVVLCGTHMGTVDLDPGTAVQNHTCAAGDIAPWVLQLDAQGNYRWSRTWTTDYIAQADEVLTDQAGNIMVRGIYGNNLDLAPGPLTVPAPQVLVGRNSYVTCLSQDGDYRWSAQWGDGVHSCYVQGFALTPDNNLRLCGWFFGAIDMDPGAGSAPFAGPMEHQSTMLIGIAQGGTTSVGALHNKSAHILIYPVPVTDQLTIVNGGGFTQATLMDGRGLVVRTWRLERTSPVLDLRELASGHYVLKLSGSSTTAFRQLVKQ